MSLIVDFRRGSAIFGSTSTKELKVVATLRRMGVPAKVGHLKFADFAFNGNGPDGIARIGIERKTVSEVIDAVRDKRFRGRQLPGMIRRYDYRYLIVEGYTNIDRASGLLMRGTHEAGFGGARQTYAAYKKFLHTIARKAKFDIEPTSGYWHTLALIHTLYWWWQAPWTSHKSVYAVDETEVDTAILDERTIRRQVAAQLPGVGWARSRQVSEHFGSIAAMVGADCGEWMAALKIQKGTKVANKLVAVCHGTSESEKAAKA